MRRRTLLGTVLVVASLFAATLTAGCGGAEHKDAKPTTRPRTTPDPVEPFLGKWRGTVVHGGRREAALGLELRRVGKRLGGALILDPGGRTRRVVITEAWLDGARLALLTRDGKDRLLFRLVLHGARLSGETIELRRTAKVEFVRGP